MSKILRNLIEILRKLPMNPQYYPRSFEIQRKSWKKNHQRILRNPEESLKFHQRSSRSFRNTKESWEILEIWWRSLNNATNPTTILSQSPKKLQATWSITLEHLGASSSHPQDTSKCRGQSAWPATKLSQSTAEDVPKSTTNDAIINHRPIDASQLQPIDPLKQTNKKPGRSLKDRSPRIDPDNKKKINKK